MYTIHCKRSSFYLILALFYAVISGHEASCSPIGVLTTITFDDPAIPFQSVDDLSLSGVTFDFKLGGMDSPEAYYRSRGPGTLTYVDDPSLTGDSAGILTLLFDHPTDTLQFGVALNTGSPLSPGFLVELFGSKQESLGVTQVDVVSAGVLGFTEGFFDHGGTAVTRAVIEFQHQPGSFALDNLTFVGIPEPASMLLGVIAVLCIVAVRPLVLVRYDFLVL
jgi:hypothetical protein